MLKPEAMVKPSLISTPPSRGHKLQPRFTLQLSWWSRACPCQCWDLYTWGHQGASGWNQPHPCPLHLPQAAAAPLLPFLGALREDTYPSTAVHYISARLDPTTSEPSLEDHFSSSQLYLFSPVPGNHRYHTTTNPERKESLTGREHTRPRKAG